MELHLFVLKDRKNIFLARQISVRQRGAVMAFIPDPRFQLQVYVVTYFTV